MQKHLALDIHARLRRLRLDSILNVDAISRYDSEQHQLEEAVNEVLTDLRKNGPTQEEIDAARTTIRLSELSRLESIGGSTGVANILNENNFLTGDPGYSSREMQKYNQVTTASVKDFARKYLNSAQSVVIFGVNGKKQINNVVPKTPSEYTDMPPQRISTDRPFNISTEKWRSSPPERAPDTVPTVVDPTKFELANGLTVYVVERHNLPTVALQVVARGGTDHNPLKKAGLSLLTIKTLTRGTERRSAEQFAHELKKSSLNLTSGSSEDTSWISIYGLTNSITQSFDLLSDATNHPMFAPKEIAKERETISSSSPVGIRILRRQLFGSRNALGYDASGTLNSRRSLTHCDLINCWSNLLVPRNSALVVAGDVTVPQAKVLAEKYFGDWRGGTPRKNVQAPFELPKQGIFIKNEKDAQQTSITIGTIGLPVDSPDYAAAQILNDIFGGLSSSRLNTNLRGQHGYTYSAASQFDSYHNSGIISVSSKVSADTAALAVKEIMGEIEKIYNAPISVEEFNTAKTNWLLSRPATFETISGASWHASNLFAYKRESYRDFQSQIAKVTLNDVQLVAHKYLDPKKMIIVLVGDKKKIEPEAKRLNFGPVVETDWQGARR